MLRQVILCKQKKPEMARTGPIPYQFDKLNCQVFINIEKCKIVFKIRNDHLRIVFFPMAI